MSICVFAAEPSHEVTVDELEAKQRASVEVSLSLAQLFGWVEQ
jgi:hypothetical protein